MKALLLAALIYGAPVEVRDAAELTAALRTAEHVRVMPGRYPGHFTIDRQLVLEGVDWPVLDGGGTGTVLTVNAPNVAVRGLELRGSGVEPDRDDAGIVLNAPYALVEDNRLRDVLFGVVVARADHSTIRGNDLESKNQYDLGRKGDGVRVWYSQGVTIEGNVSRATRDIVAWYSSDVTFRGNTVSGGRYGIHFMYCDRSLVEDNRLEGNSVGIYTMYSTDVKMRRNRVSGCRGASGYALGFKDANAVEAEGNLLVDNRVAVFVDTAEGCRVVGNVLAYNDVGVGLFPSVRGAVFEGNSFHENAEQVRLEGGGQSAGNRFEGNYWSDYEGCDLDEDGVGDVPYRSQRLFENLADRDPSLRMFSNTPAQQALDAAARLFPLVSPQPKLEDARPLVAPAALPPTASVEPSPLGLAWPLAGLLSLIFLFNFRVGSLLCLSFMR